MALTRKDIEMLDQYMAPRFQSIQNQLDGLDMKIDDTKTSLREMIFQLQGNMDHQFEKFFRYVEDRFGKIDSATTMNTIEIEMIKESLIRKKIRPSYGGYLSDSGDEKYKKGR